jgi:hypothetical protein
MKNPQRAKEYQKKLYTAIGRHWEESLFKKYWEGSVTGEQWDYLYDHNLLENNFCAWCGNPELKSDYHRSPRFSMRRVRVPICDNCFMEETGGKVQFQNTASPKSGCFIATAVYGSYHHSQVQILSKFRDEILSHNFLGVIFIKFYYLVSPTLANFIKQKTKLRLILELQFFNPLVKFLSSRYNL